MFSVFFSQYSRDELNYVFFATVLTYQTNNQTNKPFEPISENNENYSQGGRVNVKKELNNLNNFESELSVDIDSPGVSMVDLKPIEKKSLSKGQQTRKPQRVTLIASKPSESAPKRKLVL